MNGRVVVIGAPQVGKKSVLRRLGAAAREPVGKFSSFGLVLRNKYYEADIELLVLPAAEVQGEASLAVLEAAGSGESGAFDAAVLVCDLSNPGSFEHVRRWADVLAAWAPEVLFCVGTKAELCGPEHESPRKELDDWAFDRGIELVPLEHDACLDAARDSETLEFAGLARVYELLQMRTWPNMRMLGRGKGLSGSAAGAAKAPDARPQPTAGSADIALEPATKPFTDVRDTLDAAELLGLEPMGGGLGVGGDGDGDDGMTEAQMLEFEQAFEQLALFKAKLATMPHEERRAMAETLVLSLFGNELDGGSGTSDDG